MVEYNPYSRPADRARPNERVHERTVVNSGSGTGVMAAIVLLVLLGVAGFVFWTAGDGTAVNPTAPGATINEQVAPDPAADPARPVPAPDAPAIAPEAPATPAEPAPAPAIDG